MPYIRYLTVTAGFVGHSVAKIPALGAAMVAREVQVIWLSRGLLWGGGEISALRRRVGRAEKDAEVVLALVKGQEATIEAAKDDVSRIEPVGEN